MKIFRIADEQYARTVSGYLGTLGGRSFNKTNEGLCFGAFIWTSDNWTNCVLVGPDSDSVQRTPYMTLYTCTVDGDVFYVGTGGGFANATPTGDEHLPFLNFHSYPTATPQAVVEKLVSDGYIWYERTPSYTVEFNANGGIGSMQSQEIDIDISTPLDACTFTREDYDFSGWSRQAGGPVEFTDGETVLNLAADGETIILYAVWSPKPPHFILQYNESDSDHLDKDITDLHDLVGIFRDDCTIEDPVVLLEGNPDLLTGVNYFTIPKFNRSYFLTGQRIVRTNLIEITGHVDVLSSFKTYIRQQTAIVKRQETNKAYNLYIDDSSLRSYQNPIVLTQNFPQGFNGHSFILVTAGVEGTAPVNPPGDFVLTAEIDEITNNIYLTWTPSADAEYYGVTRREASLQPPFNFFYYIDSKVMDTQYVDNPLIYRSFEYQVIAINKYGQTFSNIATPSPSAFRIISQPTDYTGAIGETAIFIVQTNRPAAEVTYQWQVLTNPNDTWHDVITGGTSLEYRVTINQARLAYRFRCLANYEGTTLTSNECGIIEG